MRLVNGLLLAALVLNPAPSVLTADAATAATRPATKPADGPGLALPFPDVAGWERTAPRPLGRDGVRPSPPRERDDLRRGVRRPPPPPEPGQRRRGQPHHDAEHGHHEDQLDQGEATAGMGPAVEHR